MRPQRKCKQSKQKQEKRTLREFKEVQKMRAVISATVNRDVGRKTGQQCSSKNGVSVWCDGKADAAERGTK